MLRARLFTAVLLLCSLSLCVPAFSQNADKSNSNYSGVGVQFKMSTLGLGGDVAMGLTNKTNVRFGVNAFSYSHTFDKDGVSYKGSLALRSVQTQVDYFPFGGFHLSPGLMLYNGNKLTASGTVNSGNTFDLGDFTYQGSSNDPVKATGKMGLNKVAPMFTLGFGNLIPRSGRHVTFGFEAGFVYQGSPDIKLNFTGTACQVGGTNCINTATDTTFLSRVADEQKKLNNDASAFKFYPIISFGIGYRFGGTK